MLADIDFEQALRRSWRNIFQLCYQYIAKSYLSKSRLSIHLGRLVPLPLVRPILEYDV